MEGVNGGTMAGLSPQEDDGRGGGLLNLQQQQL